MSEKIASSDIAPFSTLFSRIISREREPAVLSPLHLLRHSLSSHCQCCRWRYAARPNPWDLDQLRQQHVAHHVICKIEKQELKETSKNSNECTNMLAMGSCHYYIILGPPSHPNPSQARLCWHVASHVLMAAHAFQGICLKISFLFLTMNIS